MSFPKIPAAAPFYVKSATVLISLIALGYLSVEGKEILCPLIFALLFSILLLPLAVFFEKKLHMHRSGAAGFAVILFILVIALIFYFIGSQISDLSKDWPMFKHQLNDLKSNAEDWIDWRFDINRQKQMSYVDTAASHILSSGTVMLSATVLSLSSLLLFTVFTLIYTFFLLLYRTHIVKFLIAVFKEEHSVTVYDILEQIQYIVRKYILGILLEMFIVSSICCIVLLILGVKYAILLGLITGLFNIIPYIGIFTAMLLSVIITFATAAGTTKIALVIITFVVIHLIDSNVLLPFIVGVRVRINALITILGVIIGEMLWGIPGMFLSLPVIAIIKIIFDRVDSLKPWGLLLGEEEKPDKEKIKKKKNTISET
jgi:predicted PurR-regulated permease PerM